MATPSSADVREAIGSWLKIITGLIAVIALVVSVSFWFGNQEKRISVLETRADASDTRSTKSEQGIDTLVTLVGQLNVKVALIMSKLGIEVPR